MRTPVMASIHRSRIPAWLSIALPWLLSQDLQVSKIFRPPTERGGTSSAVRRPSTRSARVKGFAQSGQGYVGSSGTSSPLPSAHPLNFCTPRSNQE
jgi:hypothetical protein